MVVQYDDAASIGKRYRRQDEIGTPFCLTVDFETLQDKCVTIRHRDTMKQVRITMDGLSAYIKTQMKNFKGSEWTK
jgi:glycyl-tRNA synthetase